VDAAAGALAGEVRAGLGPRFLHAITYRVKGHVSVDPAAYRHPDEVNRALGEDPLRAAAEKLAARGVAAAEIERIGVDAEREIAAAVAAAHAAPWPEVATAYAEIQDTGAGRWY
jgi:pyruvate dehydrogenase E1 component alpha subunit